MDGKRELTLMYDGKLPPLPVPNLGQTCGKYLELVKPFLTDEEFHETQFKVDCFRTGVGKLLQQKLEERAKSMKNWLADWWNDIYAEYRGPLPYISNPGGCSDLVEFWKPQIGTQIHNGAFFLYFMMRKYLMIQRQEWPISKMKKKIPMDMSLYYGLFATSRMPGINKDTILNYSLQDGKPKLGIRYIVAIKSKRFYMFDVLTPEFNILSAPDIQRQLLRIEEMAARKPVGPGVGSLTATDRPTWKRTQDYLFNLDANNRRIVDIINKSLLVLVLDNHVARTPNEAATEAMIGDCSNRWYDKGFQLITFKNGYVGVNHDHVHIDGTMTNNVFDAVIAELRACNGTWQGSSKTGMLPQPTELEFTVDDYILQKIEAAEIKHNEMRKQACVVDKPFTNFGKRFMKDHSVHPDAMVQMAIQLAYYRLHKRCAPTYESATTRQFHHARTETCRSCNSVSQRFVEAMCDEHLSNSTKVKIFREACENHDRLMNECCNGQGIDRHLLGLRKIAEQEGMELPDIYKDKAWTASGGDGNFVLSTSLSGYYESHGGMAPMVANGYGVFYTIMPDKINIVVSTYGTPETDCAAMARNLEEAFNYLRELLLSSKL